MAFHLATVASNKLPLVQIIEVLAAFNLLHHCTAWLVSTR